MTGTELKTWVESTKMQHNAFAKHIGKSVGALYNWYRSEGPLPKVIVFAVAFLGCEKAKHEASKLTGSQQTHHAA